MIDTVHIEQRLQIPKKWRSFPPRLLSPATPYLRLIRRGNPYVLTSELSWHDFVLKAIPGLLPGRTWRHESRSIRLQHESYAYSNLTQDYNTSLNLARLIYDNWY